MYYICGVIRWFSMTHCQHRASCPLQSTPYRNCDWTSSVVNRDQSTIDPPMVSLLSSEPIVISCPFSAWHGFCGRPRLTLALWMWLTRILPLPSKELMWIWTFYKLPKRCITELNKKNVLSSLTEGAHLWCSFTSGVISPASHRSMPWASIH